MVKKNMIIINLILLLVGNSVDGIYNGLTVPDPGDSLIKYPWVIRIAIVRKSEPNIMEYFGGTLITSKYILTVAHPFQEYLEFGLNKQVFKDGIFGMAYAGVYSKTEMPEIEEVSKHI